MDPVMTHDRPVRMISGAKVQNKWCDLEPDLYPQTNGTIHWGSKADDLNKFS